MVRRQKNAALPPAKACDMQNVCYRSMLRRNYRPRTNAAQLSNADRAGHGKLMHKKHRLL